MSTRLIMMVLGSNVEFTDRLPFSVLGTSYHTFICLSIPFQNFKELATGHFLRNQVFTCLNGQLGALETPYGAKKPHSLAKNLVSESCCKKCPVVN
jgi:hypothetical protein